MMKFEEYEQEGRGRSAKKRAAKGIEELAEALAELPDAAWKKAPLDDDVREALAVARRIPASGARKRQISHAASLMRRLPEETATVAAYLDGLGRERRDERAQLHRLETLRERLCTPATAATTLAEVERDFPGLDRAALQRAIHACRNSTDKKAYRTVFKLLQAALPPEAER
ncbi:MAG TPA: hypothetical protein DCF93_08945 [Desulfuromonas sp.]|nr:hypothetical protein [Desulfuromonas sp.]